MNRGPSVSRRDYSVTMSGADTLYTGPAADGHPVDLAWGSRVGLSGWPAAAGVLGWWLDQAVSAASGRAAASRSVSWATSATWL